MQWLAALVGFSLISSVTPGPNNVLLWASGVEFGFRRTVRHVAGTSLGLGAMALTAAAGIGILSGAIPQLAVVMKAAGSLYLVYLAWQIAGARALARGSLAHAMSIVQAATFQVINPKAWTFALGAVTTFRPPGMSVVAGSLAVAATMMLVILPTASLWALAGDRIGRLLTGERAGRMVSWFLAAMLVLTIALVWA